MATPRPLDIGIIGGVGQQLELQDMEELDVRTPYGAASTRLRGLAAETLGEQAVRYRDFGTAVVIDGPRFSTRAESRWHAAAGGDLVVTTLMPETTLALELGMGVVNVSFVTDSDADTGGGPGEQVSAELVPRRIAQARPVLDRTVTEIAHRIPSGFRPSTAVPQEAIAGVLAREPK